jgi:hypothetical protein
MIKDRNIADDAAIMIYKILGGAALGMGDLFVVGTADTAAFNWWKARMPAAKMFRTMKTALAACTAGRNDKIIVLPQHTEAVVAATTLDFNKAGVEIIGVGVGAYRPTITLSTATTATLTISGANTKISNLYIDSTGVDAVAVGITVTGAGLQMYNCEHYFAKTSYATILGMTFDSTATATNVILDGNFFHGDAVANCTGYINFLAGYKNVRITNNYISGNFSAAVGCITGVTAGTDLLVANNTLINSTANSLQVVSIKTLSTAFFANNRCGVVGTATQPFTTADASYFAGNWSAKVNTAGTLV